MLAHPRARGRRGAGGLPVGAQGRAAAPRARSTPAAFGSQPFVSLGLPSTRSASAPPLAASPGRGGRGASGRGRVASAQDGGLGGAGPTLAEQAPAGLAGVVREAGNAAPSGLGPGEKDAGGPRLRGPLPGVAGGPLLPLGPGTQHLRVLNGTPPVLRGASLPSRVGDTCSLGLDAGGSSTSSGLHLLWTPRGCRGRVHLFPISVTVQVII